MPEPEAEIIAHYAVDGNAALFHKIVQALAASGIAKDAITADHLKPIAEFHLGGEQATIALLDPLGLTVGDKVLDVGAGIGGPARLMTTRYGAVVTGLDLTPDFVATAKQLTKLLGLPTQFTLGSATAMPFPASTFDLATVLHVGMNIAAKHRVFTEIARVLKPGGRLAVYDVMQFGATPTFPLPWATDPATSFLATPDVYLQAAADAGLTLLTRQDRGQAAKTFLSRLKARGETAPPPVLGLPLLLGANAAAKIDNMTAAVMRGDIAPVEMVFQRTEDRG